MPQLVGIGDDEKSVNVPVTNAEGHHAEYAIAIEAYKTGQSIDQGCATIFFL